MAYRNTNKGLTVLQFLILIALIGLILNVYLG